MAIIIPFHAAPRDDPEHDDIDLITAVDVAIRDLSDITIHWGTEDARKQAEECRRMLIRAFELATPTDQ